MGLSSLFGLRIAVTRFSRSSCLQRPLSGGQSSARSPFGHTRRLLRTDRSQRWARMQPPASALPGRATTYTLIGINTAVFSLWHLQPPHWMIQHFATSEQNWSEGRWYTLLTASFSHQSLMHLAVNMFVLNSFAPPVAAVLGSAGLLTLYLVGGLGASLAHIYESQELADLRAGRRLPAIGASGAVLAICTMFALINPMRPIYVFLIIPVPAILAVGAFLAYDIQASAQLSRHSNVDHAGHIGGALTGLIFYALWAALKGRLPGGAPTRPAVTQAVRLATRRTSRRTPPGEPTSFNTKNNRTSTRPRGTAF
ncbi:uncharacterized protein MONBRDRAFT_33060 [Monosiga brevicollis MX1]|uniref:Peptidase S54 rhomboid domain-containing protein n=1 Tax=Monosiga brevicollis TaxID=81824 RepID=A9V3A3_MONBE|nr:uncharacterized protein MONBRDRAFT_33060 [Monosiga brevicollis MX1]EDQ88025.1 predicted protein [Monosiga brevicollis MX1]|eukprot:XP_001747101.1 hypothetical protein [Monosiga brevicollis MX1]